MSAPPAFYREAIPEQICQGDIFDRVPLSYPADEEATAYDFDLTRGILLTHDCQIDKPETKLATIALVRPLAPLSADRQRLIREGRVLSCFFLAADSNGDESFVDFGRMSQVPNDLLRRSQRLASLGDTAWAALLFQLVRCR